MGRQQVALAQFNRGRISPLALARTDLKRVAFAAETMTNWMPRVFGSMMLRPGFEYLGSSRSDQPAKYIDFVFSTGDTALVEITASNMRVWVDGVLITRGSVSTAIANGGFATNLTSWTDDDEAGGVSAWVTGGYMGLTGNGTAAAIRRQQVTVAGPDQNREHAVTIVIERGPVTLRVGSTSGGDEYISETQLNKGAHSLAFTPTGDFFVHFESRLKRQVLVDAIAVESPQTMTVTAPWSADNLDDLRWDQSGDIIFVACSGKQQYRIVRRGENSWSAEIYQANDGPFRLINTGPITIAAGALSGNSTLTASAALFKSSHVGALFQLTSSGQTVSANIAAQNTFTNSIRVTGTGTSRSFTVSLSGVWVGTVTLQRSFDSGVTWVDVTTYTNTSTTYSDGLDNQIVLYRIGIKTGDYTSGTATVLLAITTGSITGIGRITGYTSSTVVDVEIIDDFGSTSATENWSEGEWSDYRGWPTSVGFVEGRLGWAGKNGVWLSVSDSFDSFDEETEGDSGPIARTIGSGPVDTINWMLPLQRLILGAEGAEFVCKSSSLDEPLTPNNFNVKQASTQGSAAVRALRVDKHGIYVQRGGTRVMRIAMEDDSEYGSSDLTILTPEITKPYVVRMAVQRQPDTRIHCVLSDGNVAIAVMDRAEDVLCWLLVETDGTVEDVSILPGADGESEDVVYYHVNRNINGSTKRYLERWALEEDCIGGTLNQQADSFLIYSGALNTTITGLGHLEGETVVVWGNGVDLGTYVVTASQITGLTSAVTDAVIGLGYTAQWKSTKLAYAAGTSLTQKKNVSHLGVIMRNTHYQGLKYGTDFTTMYDLPRKEKETEISADTVHTTYDEEPFEFPGQWESDLRLCLQAQAPRPCTLLAAVIAVEAHEKS